MKYLIAHRSLDNHNYPENSLLGAIDCLTKDYISGIEIDVRITKDKKLVMYHNLLYNLNGINKLYYKDLKDIDLLEDLLKKIKSNKIILLDIKCETNNYQALVKCLIKLLNKYPLNYYICSFNYQLIKDIRGKINYPIGIFITDLINKNKSYAHLSFLALSKNSYEDVDYKLKFVWTINNKKDLDKYEYIITDKAYLLK